MRFVFCYNGHLRKMPQKTQFKWFWFLKSFALHNHIMDNVMIRWRCFLAVHWNWQYCECFCCQTHVLHVTVKLLHVIHVYSQFCVYQHCIAHILPHVLFCNTLSCVFENQCSAMLCFVFCTRLWSVVDAFERAVLCVLPVCMLEYCLLWRPDKAMRGTPRSNWSRRMANIFQSRSCSQTLEPPCAWCKGSKSFNICVLAAGQG